MGTRANLYIKDNGKLLMTKFVHFDGYKDFTGTKILEFIMKYKDKLDVFRDIEIEEFDHDLYDKIMGRYYEIETDKSGFLDKISKAQLYLNQNIVSPLMIVSNTVADFFNFVISARPRVLQDFQNSYEYSPYEYTIDIGERCYYYSNSDDEEEEISFDEITEDNIEYFNNKGYKIGSMPYIFPYVKL